MSIPWVSVLLGAGVLLSLPALAQTFGEITGVVSDPSGGVVVGASLTVTNPQTNFTRRTTTNSAGNYSFPSLQPGLYNVRAEMQGFQTEIRNGVELQVEQVARIDFQLRVGAVAETVEVAGGAPLLNTENVTVGTVIDNQRIVDLPLNGRNFVQLIALSPNVSANFTSNGGQANARQGGDRTTQEISVSGLRREFNNFTLDGIENTDANFNTYIFLPSIDALQEFKVQTGVYSAEFGRRAAQVNVSTKSGTNEYHGTVFEFLRNNDLDARPFGFTSSVPVSAPFKWNQYGFTLDGPVQIPRLFNGKNRLFFMSNFEGFKLRNQTQAYYSTIPAAMRNGDFSGIKITDPLNNNAPFPNSQIPSTRFNATALKLLEFYPAPNVSGAGLTNNYLSLDNNTTDKVQFTQRVDFVESAKSSWFGRYSWQDETAVNPLLDLNGTNLATNVKQAMVSNTRILSTNVVNEFRFGFNNFFNTFGRELAFQRDVVKELNLNLLSDPVPAAWGIPSIVISGFSAFGDNTEGPYTIWDHTFQWTDGVSWTHGRHSLKLGGEIRRDRFNQTGNQFARGQFTVQNQATGYGASDYMLGYAAQTADAAALAIVQFRATSHAYYLDDSWKVRPNLTVDLGLRYEYTPPWADKSDSLVNVFIPSYVTTPQAPAELHPTLVRIGSGDFYANTVIRFDPKIPIARDGRLGDRLIFDDKKNFAPRLGIAWAPTTRWTIRSGFGLFFVQDTGNPRFDMARNLSGRVIDTANTQTHDLTFDHPFTVGSGQCGVPSPPYVCITSPFVLGNDPYRKTPYVIQYEMNFQRQLSNNMVAEVGYLGSEGHRLERLMYANQPVPSPTDTVVNRSPFPEYGLIQQVRGIVNSNYNSLTAKLTRRMSSGLTFLAGYTFSKSIDDGSGIRVLGADHLQPQNSNCVECERGLSVFDQRHRFVTSALYELPVGKGRRYLNHGVAGSILGGWDLSTTFTAASGAPIDFSDGTDQSRTGLNLDRPNVVPGASLSNNNPNPNAWFNKQAVALQDSGTFGNMGRNVLIGPGVFSMDFATKKNFYFTERKYLQFRFETFNALNHPNFGDPNTSVTANAFGTITTTKSGIDMRELQFALKLVF